RGRKEPEALAAASLKRVYVENRPYLVGGFCQHDTVANINKNLMLDAESIVDESLRAEDVEIYYDPADLISKLLKESLIPEQQNVSTIASPAIMGSCPFKKPE
ncbi:hypothetical protein Tco_0790610, partial [Tanacetum coccineum]